MVCLTSCVFRSIRFSGFARPHRLGCGARENYTRTCGRGQACGRRYMRRTQIGGYCLFETAFSEEGRAWAASPTARASRPGFGALGRAEARRPSGRPRNGRPRQAALRRPPPIGAGTQVARRGCDTRGSARALAHKGARFLTPPPLCQFRVASINAKSPPPFAGKRAP